MAGARRIGGGEVSYAEAAALALERRLRPGAAVQPVGRRRRRRSTRCSTACSTPQAAGRWQADPDSEARRLDLLPQTAPLAWDELMHHALNLQVRFSVVRADALEHWMKGLHHQHFIVMNLYPPIGGGPAGVTTIVSSHGMNVDWIHRLSGELSPDDPGANACVEVGGERGGLAGGFSDACGFSGRGAGSFYRCCVSEGEHFPGGISGCLRLIWIRR